MVVLAMPNTDPENGFVTTRQVIQIINWGINIVIAPIILGVLFWAAATLYQLDKNMSLIQLQVSLLSTQSVPDLKKKVEELERRIGTLETTVTVQQQKRSDLLGEDDGTKSKN